MSEKRYLVFAGMSYYPKGGWGDFIDSYDSPGEAKETIANPKFIERLPETGDWWAHVVCEGVVVLRAYATCTDRPIKWKGLP